MISEYVYRRCRILISTPAEILKTCLVGSIYYCDVADFWEFVQALRICLQFWRLMLRVLAQISKSKTGFWCMWLRVCVWESSIHTYIHVCVCVCVCVCIYIYICICIYMYGYVPEFFWKLMLRILAPNVETQNWFLVWLCVCVCGRVSSIHTYIMYTCIHIYIYRYVWICFWVFSKTNA
jgi:hypothetical protein